MIVSPNMVLQVLIHPHSQVHGTLRGYHKMRHFYMRPKSHPWPHCFWTAHWHDSTHHRPGYQGFSDGKSGLLGQAFYLTFQIGFLKWMDQDGEVINVRNGSKWNSVNFWTAFGPQPLQLRWVPPWLPSWKTQNGGRTCGLKWLQRRRRRWRRKAWVTWKRWHRKGYWWFDNLISLGFRLIHCCTLNK